MKLNDKSLLRQEAYICGDWIAADSGETIAVTDPASGEVLGTVPNMGGAEARRAIEAAEVAFPNWRAKTAKERAVIIRRWYELLIENADDLALIMTHDRLEPARERDVVGEDPPVVVGELALEEQHVTGACAAEDDAPEASGRRRVGSLVAVAQTDERVLAGQDHVVGIESAGHRNLLNRTILQGQHTRQSWEIHPDRAEPVEVRAGAWPCQRSHKQGSPRPSTGSG